MRLFKSLNEKEEIDEFLEMEDSDDKKLLEYFECCNHKEFTFAMMHIGAMLESTAIYLNFAVDMIDDMISDVEENHFRRFNKFLNDLNKKIITEFDLPDDSAVIEGALIENELYLFINKMKFLKYIQLQDL